MLEGGDADVLLGFKCLVLYNIIKICAQVGSAMKCMVAEVLGDALLFDAGGQKVAILEQNLVEKVLLTASLDAAVDMLREFILPLA